MPFHVKRSLERFILAGLKPAEASIGAGGLKFSFLLQAMQHAPLKRSPAKLRLLMGMH